MKAPLDIQLKQSKTLADEWGSCQLSLQRTGEDL